MFPKGNGDAKSPIIKNVETAMMIPVRCSSILIFCCKVNVFSEKSLTLHKE